MEIISKKAIELLQYRIQQEELSSRLYEQIALYLDDVGFLNFSKLFKKFAHEESNHAGWAKQYLLDHGVQPELDDLDAPISNYKGLPDIIKKTYNHEVEISKQCNELAKEAMKLNDFRLFDLAQKYNHEQIEELGKAKTLTDLLKTFGEDPHTLLLLDSHIDEYFEL